ncbi:MAG TPA: CsiV family protein [Steroidobacteraceae bacterium]|nr:CsiV family protein [Steroidobacteraceae bacterium]
MNTLLRPLRLYGLAFTLLAMSLPAIPQAAAQQTAGRYTVEIVVFRADGDSSGEDGAAATPLKSTVGDIMTTAVTTRRLAAAASKLRSAGGYRILAHTAWSQMPAAWNSRRGVPIEQLGVNAPSITGNVVLERGQFVHLGLDLKIEDGGRSFVLAELRQVKLDEALYFDHPQLGVIALVTRSAATP